MYPVLLMFYLSTLRNPASSPTKLLCFTRSSPLIHQLPAQYPSTVLANSVLANSVTQQTLSDLVFPEPSKLVVCTLSSLLSQSTVQEMLKGFVLSDMAQVSFQAWNDDAGKNLPLCYAHSLHIPFCSLCLHVPIY